MTILFREISNNNLENDFKSKIIQFSEFSTSKFTSDKRTKPSVHFNPQAKFYNARGKYTFRFISEFKILKQKYFNKIVNYFGVLDKNQFTKLLKFSIFKFNSSNADTIKRHKKKIPSDIYFKEFPPLSLLQKAQQEDSTLNATTDNYSISSVTIIEC